MHQRLFDYISASMSSTFDLVSRPGEATRNPSKKALCVCIVLVCILVAACVALTVVLILGLHCSKQTSTTPSTKSKTSLDDSVKFLWITDLHLDTFYNDEVTSKPTLCRKLGSYGNASYKARYGRVGCDSPVALIDSMFASASGTVGDARFVLITGKECIFITGKLLSCRHFLSSFWFSGDLSAHDVNEPYFNNATKPSERTLNNIFTSINKTRATFSRIPAFPMLGNNDLPGHYQLPLNNDWYTKTLASFAPLILCDGCPDDVPKPTDMETLKKTFLDGGYYRVNLPNTGEITHKCS